MQQYDKVPAMSALMAASTVRTNRACSSAASELQSMKAPGTPLMKSSITSRQLIMYPYLFTPPATQPPRISNVHINTTAQQHAPQLPQGRLKHAAGCAPVASRQTSSLPKSLNICRWKGLLMMITSGWMTAPFSSTFCGW